MSVFEFIKTLQEQIRNAWNRATATEPSLAHLTKSELAFFEGPYGDFLDKAGRGYFDDDVRRDFRIFLNSVVTR